MTDPQKSPDRTETFRLPRGAQTKHSHPWHLLNFPDAERTGGEQGRRSWWLLLANSPVDSFRWTFRSGEVCCVVLFCCFEEPRVSSNHYVVKDNLELLISCLLPPKECWDNGSMPPFPVSIVLIKLGPLPTQRKHSQLNCISSPALGNS